MADSPGTSEAIRSSRVDSWICQAKAGSQEALGALADACRQYLLTIANAELADELRPKFGGSDVVQQTLLEACRDFASFTGEREAELLAWLRKILLNNLSSLHRQYRETKKRSVGREVVLDSNAPNGGQGVAGMAAADPSPSVEVASAEQERLVAEAIAKLPEPLRQVIILRHRDSMSFPEIAAVMNRSPEAVRKLWVRGVDWLKRELCPPHERSAGDV